MLISSTKLNNFRFVSRSVISDTVSTDNENSTCSKSSSESIESKFSEDVAKATFLSEKKIAEKV